MKSDEEATSELFHELENAKNGEEYRRFRVNHPATEGKMTLSKYFNEYLGAKKGLSASDIVRKACLSREYGLAILNGSKKNPSRDRVIALCAAAGMSVKEANRALRYADRGMLSPKNDRDAIIILCMNLQITSVVKINIRLSEEGLPILGTFGRK